MRGLHHDENDFIDLSRGDAGILEGCLARRGGALATGIDPAFKLGARRFSA